MTGEEERAYAAAACRGHQRHLCFHPIGNERYWVLGYREGSGKSVGRGGCFRRADVVQIFPLAVTWAAVLQVCYGRGGS